MSTKPSSTQPTLADALRQIDTECSVASLADTPRVHISLIGDAVRAELPRAEAADALAEAAEAMLDRGYDTALLRPLRDDLRAALRRYREGGAK